MNVSYSCPALLLGLLLGAAAPVAAQTPTAAATTTPAPRPRQALKLGLFSSETVGLSYERQWGPRYSLQATLGYWTNGYRSGGSSLVTDSVLYQLYPPYRARAQRLVLTAQVRRYLQASKPALVGWYAGAGLQLLGEWTRYRFDNGSVERQSYHKQTVLLRFGRQCQLGRRFTFDFALGPQLDLGVRRRYEYNPGRGTLARTGPRQFYAYFDAGLALQVGYRL